MSTDKTESEQGEAEIPREEYDKLEQARDHLAQVDNREVPDSVRRFTENAIDTIDAFHGKTEGAR